MNNSKVCLDAFPFSFLPSPHPYFILHDVPVKMLLLLGFDALNLLNFKMVTDVFFSLASSF